MVGAKGSALEWALALLRAPGERHALRQKPLPAGVDRLLGIAAGAMPEALAEAMRTFGEPEARIREAAQFYAREVLFFPQADAYRVLGVDTGASAEQIKSHHRLLQHWLHPDRLRNEDDAVFAARVNSAWNHLRSPERRQAYDEALRQDRPPEVFDSSDTLRSVHSWVPEPTAAPPDRWRHRLPMLALSAACVLLVLLVLRDMGRRPEAWDFPDRRDAVTAAADDALEISVPRREAVDAPLAQSRKRSEPLRPSRNAVSPAVATHFPSPQPVAAYTPLASAMTPAAVSPPPMEAPPPTATTMPAVEVAQAAPQPAPPPAADAPVVPRPVPKSAVEASAPSFARIQSARQAGDQFLRYMGAVGRSPPPIWNSPAIQSSADRMRQDLHGKGRAHLSAAQWRIGNETAVLAYGYKVQGSNVEAGMLTADLMWREGRWLVTGVSMERAR